MPTKQAPLVTAVMPTNRPRLARVAVELFLAQSYPVKEMIVIDDAPESIALPPDPRIKHIRTEPMTIGAKHNLACGLAQGEYIAHWDDDDWFAPRRLALQVEPLALGKCAISGIPMSHQLKFRGGEFYVWARGFPRGTRAVKFKFHDSTAAFTRKVWDFGIRYSNLSMGEKVDFIEDAMLQGFEVLPVPNRGLFVYGRHGENAWNYPDAWLRKVVKPGNFPDADLERYTKIYGGSNG